eukprot:2003883-Amphidinium_carterae.2
MLLSAPSECKPGMSATKSCTPCQCSSPGALHNSWGAVCSMRQYQQTCNNGLGKKKLKLLSNGTFFLERLKSVQ